MSEATDLDNPGDVAIPVAFLLVGGGLEHRSNI